MNSVHLIDACDNEDALGFFAPEEPERSDSLPNSLIERQPRPPIVRRNVPSSVFHFGGSGERTSPWPSRSTRVWDAVVLVSVAALAIFVFAPGRGLWATAGVSRSIMGAMTVELPVVNPPPALWRAPDVPVTLALDSRVDVPRPRRDATADRAAASARVAGPKDLAIVRSDTNAVQAVVGRYLNAFTNLDVEEARAVWPTVNETALSRAFASLDEQKVELSGCAVTVAGGKADASCLGVVRYVPKVGSKTMFVQRRRWTFELRNSGSLWFIENVETH